MHCWNCTRRFEQLDASSFMNTVTQSAVLSPQSAADRTPAESSGHAGGSREMLPSLGWLRGSAPPHTISLPAPATSRAAGGLVAGSKAHSVTPDHNEQLKRAVNCRVQAGKVAGEPKKVIFAFAPEETLVNRCPWDVWVRQADLDRDGMESAHVIDSPKKSICSSL